MRICLLSLGCKVNQAEIIQMESDLSARGHDLVGMESSPEVCVINTCTVTARSDSESRQLIRKAGRLGARVFVTGCYAELNKEEAASLYGVEGVLGNTDKNNIINVIDNNNKSNTSHNISSRTRRIIKIQDGCDFECSYCIVWKARGQSRSLGKEDVVEQVEKAVSEGIQEVVLAGVHLGLFGKDLEPASSLSGLVEELLLRTNIKRIRLSSLEINEIDDRLLEHMHDGRVCRHLHLPLQSGDDEVLRVMNRSYDSLFFMRRVDEITKKIPGIAIGTDIIAGFPLETEMAFHRSLTVVGSLPFSYAHVFKYSRRKGTVASRMKDIVGDENRRERAYLLREMAEMKKKKYLDSQAGSILNVLIEEKDSEGSWVGTSENYLKVRVASERLTRGIIIPVRIESIDGKSLCGKPINNFIST